MKTLIIVALSLVGFIPASGMLQNVDFNFWGIDGSGNPIDPANEGPLGAHHWNNALTTQQNASNVTLGIPLPTNTLALESGATATCGGGLAIASGKHDKALSAPEDSVPTGCQLSFNRGDAYMHDGLYQRSYDTLKAAVQNCPTFPDAPGAFGTMANDVQNKGDGPIPQSLPDFQHWLISALAWNPGNSDYFCADVHAMMGTVATGNIDTSWQQMNNEANRGMSVLYWLIHNPVCWNPSDTELYVNSRGSQKEDWIDWPGMDTSKTPLDTTIYSMHDLGLDSVLKYAGMLGVNNANTTSILSNATASPNPAGTGTEISFSTSREAYVKIDLFNLLGVKVGNAGFESVVQPGNHEVPLSLSGLPSGTYYARIVTTYGEVQTVKLVKE